MNLKRRMLVLLSPEPALCLAMLRIAVATIVLLSPETWDGPRLAALAPSLREAPEGLGWALAVLPIDRALARAAQDALVAATVSALLGLWSRTAAFVMTLTAL